MNISQKVLAMSLSVSLLGTGAGMSQVAQAHDASHESVTKTDSKAVELRSNLDMLLSEHAYLAADTMRKGAEGSKDFDESVKSLNMNTKELSKAIGDVYGKDAGMEFEKMWSEHIGYFVDYVEASKNNDKDAKQEAKSNLDNYSKEFGAFLSKATDNQLKSNELADGLGMHVDQLLASFDAYTKGDYKTSTMKVREAYAHMFMPAKGLSNAIVMQNKSDFEMDMPKEMPDTGAQK